MFRLAVLNKTKGLATWRSGKLYVGRALEILQGICFCEKDYLSFLHQTCKQIHANTRCLTILTVAPGLKICLRNYVKVTDHRWVLQSTPDLQTAGVWKSTPLSSQLTREAVRKQLVENLWLPINSAVNVFIICHTLSHVSVACHYRIEYQLSVTYVLHVSSHRNTSPPSTTQNAPLRVYTRTSQFSVRRWISLSSPISLQRSAAE